MHRPGPAREAAPDEPEAGELLAAGEVRPYTNEELATAHQAAKDFVDSLGEAGQLVTARDLAMFDAGFKRGRRTPPPATGQARLEAARQCAKNWARNRATRDTIVNAFLAGCHWMDNNQTQAKAARRGFTLVELLVVMLIIGLVAVGVLPMVVSAIQERGVVSAAQLVQASIEQAKAEAVASQSLRGIRLIPDPTTLPARLADGSIDPSKPLIARQIVQIAAPPSYTEGRVTILNVPYPVTVTSGWQCLVLEQSPGRWEPTGSGYVWLPNPPTSWAWNLRVGEKITIGVGAEYTICGPMAILPGDGNPEQFINYGVPGVGSGITRTYTSPDGLSSVDTEPEVLLLTNGLDDDHDGLSDEGWDGVDNDNDGLVDEPDEWEQELWRINSASTTIVDSPYQVRRRAIPAPNTRVVDLPGGAVIDLTGWGSGNPQRSRTNVDRYSGAVNLLVDPSGRFSYDLPYGVLTGLGMDRATFAHIWVGTTADMVDPVEPMPNPKDDARLITLNKSGLTSVLTVNPDALLPKPGDLPEIILESRRGER